MPNHEEYSHSLIARIENFPHARVLCVGDVMLDRFIYGRVDRISPEAPVPVFLQENELSMLGGAGNVVRNISALGAECVFISVIGQDVIGKSTLKLIEQEARVTALMLVDAMRSSTEKTRYVSASQQLFRADRETQQVINHNLQAQILENCRQNLTKVDILVLSDYGKGVLSGLSNKLIDLANQSGVKVVVDPKSQDFSVYKNAWLITPNFREFCAASNAQPQTPAQLEQAARELMAQHQIENMLVTQGSKGMTLFSADAENLYIPAIAREVFDVSGAGDTVLANLSVAIASGATLAEAAYLANSAAGIAVSRAGTAIVSSADLKMAIYTQEWVDKRKIYPRNLAAEQVDLWQSAGLKVGFTNGCFDLLHTGHVSLLNDSKSACDRLVVAINTDASVRRLKGDGRPVTKEMDRALLLAELPAVDMVVLFDEDTPLELIKLLLPDVLMKGADYKKDQVVGADIVENAGGEVRLIPLREGYSTTSTIARINSHQKAS